MLLNYTDQFFRLSLAWLSFSGLLWAQFPDWKTLRSFALNVLREEGMGKQRLESRILDEVRRYCDHFIDPCLGQPISLSTLDLATCNMISELLFGGRSDYEDQKFRSMVDSMKHFVKANQQAAITKNIPMAQFFRFSGIQELSESTHRLRPEVERWVEKSKSSPNYEEPQNIFDHFFLHQKRNSDKSDAFSGEISDQRYLKQWLSTCMLLIFFQFIQIAMHGHWPYSCI